MLSRFFRDPFFDDPFFLSHNARSWGFSDPFEEMRRDPFFRDHLALTSGPQQNAGQNQNQSQAVTPSGGSDSKQMAAYGPQGASDHEWLTAYARAPNMDIVQRDKEYQINVDLPGVKKEDIKVNVTEMGRGHKMLTVSGERKDEATKEDKEKGYYSRRSMYGKFSRSIALPENVDAKPEAIQAKMEDGVLKIVLPKTKEPEKKAVDVKVH